jgi:hypothetical protein
MFRGSVFACISILSVGLTLLAQDTPTKKGAPKGRSSATSSLTGCLDQQDGQYVLANETDMAPLAKLEAEGFPTEGFAKYMGHKITVRGTSTPAEPRPVFRVRSIENISDTCAPQSK